MTDTPNNKQPEATLQERLHEALADPVRRDIDRRLALLEQQLGALRTETRTGISATRELFGALERDVMKIDAVVQRELPTDLDAVAELEQQERYGSPRARFRGLLHGLIDRVLGG